MIIRKAEIRDLEELLEIYNFEVGHGVATFDLYPKTMEEWRQWFFSHNIDNHPLLVAEVDHRIAGYVSLSSYREKEAYHSTVELSLYIAQEFRRRRIATKLMEAILKEAMDDERIHTVVSVITGENEVSIHLHEKFGFSYCGTIHEVGYKMGKYLDIVNYELQV